MKQSLWIAMILIAIPGAAQTVTSTPASQQESLTEITISAPEPRYVVPTRRDRIGRIWAPVYLDGKGPFRFVLDTGASHSAITAQAADAMGAQARTGSTVRVHGDTGSAIVPIIRVDELVVGDLKLSPAKLPVVPDVFGGADGVLGNEGLHDKRVVIDFKRDSISIKRSRRERADYGYSTVPFTLEEDYLPIIEARVGGIPVKAIIDTGAPDSLGNMALLNALKLHLGDTTDTQIQGVTLDVQHGHRARGATIYFQDIQVRSVTLNFGDVYIFQHWRMTREPALMIGMDVLGVMDQIIIDYRTRELQILNGTGGDLRSSASR
jgi:predicted aspartyl protease